MYELFPLRIEQLISASSAEYRADAELPAAPHAGWVLVYLHSGNIEERCDDRRILLHPGALLLHPPGEVSAMRTVGGVPPEVLRVEFLCTGESAELMHGFVTHAEPGEQRDTQYIMQKVRLLFDADDPTRLRGEPALGEVQQMVLRLEDLLILMVRRCRQPRRQSAVRQQRERRQTALVEAARSYFAANLHSELHIGALCEALGCSRAQLQQAFRARTRSTAGAEFTAMRLDYAAQLLARGALPGEVAAEMGYCSGAHFSKKFREATGNTPAEYRRQQMYLTARRQNRQQKDIDEP